VKLSNREKKLLTVLVVTVALLCFYKYILRVQFNRIKELEKRIAIHKLKITEMKEVSHGDSLDHDFQVLNAKIGFITRSLYPTIKQDKMITILDEAIQQSNLNVVSINFSDIVICPLDDPGKKLEPKDYGLKQLAESYHQCTSKKRKTEENPIKERNHLGKDFSNAIEQMTATIQYHSGSYASLLSFLKQVEEYHKKTLIKSIDINRNEEGSLTGEIMLVFYAVPKLHQQDQEYLNWNLQNLYGKENPFDP
jgi:type IV pilus assembly protein PilO